MAPRSVPSVTASIDYYKRLVFQPSQPQSPTLMPRSSHSVIWSYQFLILKSTVSLCLLPQAHLLLNSSTPCVPTHILLPYLSAFAHADPTTGKASLLLLSPILIDNSQLSSCPSSTSSSQTLPPMPAQSQAPSSPYNHIALGISFITLKYNSLCLCAGRCKDDHRFSDKPPIGRWGLSPAP